MKSSKNIHVIPTDKLSKLIRNHSGVLTLGKEFYTISENKQNTYITNDEKIKKGDWVYSEARNTLFKVKSIYNTSVGCLLIEDDVIMPLEINEVDCKKIILTTDLDLINDGVQAIDDEFLEWFVKNPSCEVVEVKYGCQEQQHWGWALIGKPCTCKKITPRIIIPKEEHKQVGIDWSDFPQSTKDKVGYVEPKDVVLGYKPSIVAQTLDKLITKQETPEKNKCSAGCKHFYGGETKHHKDCFYYPESFSKMYDDLKSQQKRRYSEEEVIEIAKNSYNEGLSSVGFSKVQFGNWFTKWFEQFKKK